jgi:archaellum component FlaC
VPLPPSPDIAHELAESGKGVLRLIPRIITIMDTMQRLTKAVEKQAGQTDAIRERLDRLEAREEMLLAKIEAAASRATADMAGRLGRIEGLIEARDRRD